MEQSRTVTTTTEIMGSSSLNITSPMTQSMARRNHELHNTLHRAETLISNSSSLVHPPWMEENRKQRQLQIEKEKQQELNNARQWASRSTRLQNEDDEDNGKPMTEELLHTKLKLRLLMGQSIEKATNGLPLPGTLGGGRGGVTISTVTNMKSTFHHHSSSSTRRGILGNISQDAAMQRQTRRRSLEMGQGITEAFQRRKNSNTGSELVTLPPHLMINTGSSKDTAVSPRHERRHHKTGLQKPDPTNGTTRRNSQGYIKGALDAAAEGNIGFTGIHLDNAPLHTKHLEELRRQVIEASRAVATRRQDVLIMIDTHMQPNWRPEGRVKYFASLNAVNIPSSSTSSNTNNNDNDNDNDKSSG